MYGNLILFFCWLAGGVQLLVPETGIFRPPFSSHLLASPREEIFLLNQTDAEIRVYSANGELIRQIGRKGQGPGEFRFPRSISLLNEQLFVFDNGAVHLFDEEGKFLETKRHPSMGSLSRIAGGYLLRETLPGRLTLVDDSFGQEVLLAEWGNDRDQESLQQSYDRLRDQPINIYPDLPYWDIDPAGQRIYWRLPGTKEILIFNTISKAIVRTLSINVDLIPVNLEYAEAVVTRLKQSWQVRGDGGQRIEIPEYFPLLDGMKVAVDGTLIVRARDPINSRQFRFWHFSPEGEPIQPGLSFDAASRVLGIFGSHAYVTLFDEELQIARVPLVEVNDFVTQNPYSWP